MISKIKNYIIGFLVAAGGILAVMLKIKSDEADKEKAEKEQYKDTAIENEKTIEAMSNEQKVKTYVSSLSDANVLNGLHKYNRSRKD